MKFPGLVGEALEGLVAPFDDEGDDWADVLARAKVEGRRRRRRAEMLVLAAVGLVAVLALAPPFGLAGRIVGIFRDEGRPISVASLTRREREELTLMFCRRVELLTPPGRAPKKRCLDGEPTISEIANNGSRLYWKLTFPSGMTCLASGPVRGYRTYGGGRTHIGMASCPARVPTPRRPITSDELAIALETGAARPRVLSASGLAGEGIESVGLIDESGDVVKTPVRGRTYQFGQIPDRPWVAIAAFDESGDEVYREGVPLARQPPPRRNPRPPRPRRPPWRPVFKGPPIQHGEVPGATIDVYRLGFVKVRFTSTTGRARLVPRSRGYPGVPVGCADVALGAGRWELLGAAVGVRIRGGASPPFDICSVRGTYGRRWNDARGMHDAFEFAFTPLGKRFFAEQAAGRDLALFMRTPQMREVRKAMIQKRAIPTSAEIASRFPSRVVALTSPTGFPPRPNIGVWSNGKDQVVAARQADDGRRLFVTFRSGVFGPHNLKHLGFLLY